MKKKIATILSAVLAATLFLSTTAYAAAEDGFEIIWADDEEEETPKKPTSGDSALDGKETIWVTENQNNGHILDGKEIIWADDNDW